MYPAQEESIKQRQSVGAHLASILCERAQSVSNSEILIEDLAPREYALGSAPLSLSLSLSESFSLLLWVQRAFEKGESKMYMHGRK